MSAEDRWLSGWLLALCAAAAALLALNAALSRFSWISYIPHEISALPVVMLELAWSAPFIRRKKARLGSVIAQTAYFGLTVSAVSVLTTGLQVTPFAPMDAALQRWDAALGCDVLAAMAWTAARPWLRSLLQWAYFLLNFELFLLPFAAAFFQDRRALRVYMYAVAYSFFFGGLFYYVFPSSGPASILQSPYFSAEQLSTGRKFFEVHHGLPVSTVLGGMIAFPSFHAVWAVLLTWTARPHKALFAVALALNSLVLLSTVLLGWHFLVDVLVSLPLAAAALYAAERTHARFAAKAK